MNSNFWSLLLSAGIALSAPLMFAAMGEVLSEKAGVINIELEGMMLAGAFLGVWSASRIDNIPLAFLAAAVGGIIVAVMHGVMCFVFRTNQVVSGVVLNLAVLGLTTFGSETIFGSNVDRSVSTLKPIHVPVLSDLPLLGRVLFRQTLGVYVAFLLIAVVWFMLERTRAGLAVKAAGERPEAAEALGVAVQRVRWSSLVACGFLAGLGGGQLTLASLGVFTPNITAGVGFIALAAVVFGRWKPLGAAAAVILFAVTQAFYIRAQALGIHVPYQLLVALPYLVTLVALALLPGRSRAPRALGLNYQHG